MDASEIKDAESLQAWLESLPQETSAQRETARRWAVTIAHRAAMRVLPVFWTKNLYQEKKGLLVAPFLRCLLTSDIACSTSTAEFEYLSRDAYKAAHRVANSVTKESTSETEYVIFAFASAHATAATYSSARVASNSTGAAIAFATFYSHLEEIPKMWQSVKADCINLLGSEHINESPLWIQASDLVHYWENGAPNILAQGDGWRFWVEWYENALHGRPQDYDLLNKIALIAPADWDKGADHVNALIQQIVTGHKPKPTPHQPEITDVERSHINLVLAAPEPARQSAEFLQKQFENMEQAYRRELGCPNETPPELEPIVTLSRTFGQIAELLRYVDDKDRLIVELTAKIRTLEANNAQLVSALSGEKGAFMRGVMMGALGNVAGAAIIQGFAYVVGPFASEALPSLWEFLKPHPELPRPAIPPVFDA